MCILSSRKCVFSEFVFGACLCAPLTGVLFLSQLEAEFDKKKMLEAVSLIINLSYIQSVKYYCYGGNIFLSGCPSKIL